MTPQDQIMLHEPDKGFVGDCFRACVASILDMNIRKVPHFASYPSDFWIQELIRWLKAHGYELNGTSDYTDERVEAEQGVDGYLIVAGESPRNVDVRHAVVYYGKKMVHDPHPDKTGIVKPEYYYRIEKADWAESRESKPTYYFPESQVRELMDLANDYATNTKKWSEGTYEEFVNNKINDFKSIK